MAKKIKGTIEKPEWLLLEEEVSTALPQLLSVYKVDPKKAKILYHQKKADVYYKRRVVVFEWGNSNFRIANIQTNYGISKTNRIYHHDKDIASIRYTDGKFYYCYSGFVKQLTFQDIINFMGKMKTSSYANNPCYQYLVNKFGWIRNICESRVSYTTSFNLIVRNKLYNEKALVRHLFKVPYPVYLILDKNTGYNIKDFLKKWKIIRNYLINVDNLTVELFTSKYFDDMCHMAESLGEKINCRWGPNRLKVEHDKWSKRITEVLLEFEEKRNLKINNIFHEFKEFSGYELLLTNHDLIEEGKMMSHCVATYSGKVDAGTTGIYRVFGCTLELSIINCRYSYGMDKKLSDELGLEKIIRIGQYSDFKNTAPSDDKYNLVRDMVLKFNTTEMSKHQTVNIYDEQPF